MIYVVMPSDKNLEISYRVKYVTVENEKVFGDVVVTKQTRERLSWIDSPRFRNFERQRLPSLRKQILETPDFMALNRKPERYRLRAEITKTLDKGNAFWKNLPSVDGKIIDLLQRPNHFEQKRRAYPLPMLGESTSQEIVVTSLVDQLLLDIYGYPRSGRGRSESDSTASSYKPPPQHRHLRKARLLRKSDEELAVVLETLRQHVNHAGGLLIRQLRRRDYLIAKRDKQYDVITAHLQAYSAKRSEDTRMRFSLTPQPGESGFTQWLDAMKMVARLQGGIPSEFRKRLWLTLAERHLDQRGVDWKQAEKLCFNEWSNPDDEELGIQIVKDLHRTGCSLFCGAAGRDNQAVLRRVLLGFARWNKSVGYCQGLNVLAALVLQVTDRAESSAVKVMIYLIEGVLPEGYFADNLRGLSIDMAVFRDLLRMRLPKLSRHLEALQCDAKDKATGSSYEPPLTNVFTMQWFLTLFCHCLPQEAVLRVWDLIFLEGDEVLLRTALAIWEGISDRIMTVTSADEFYSIMGVLTREMLEFTDVNNLIKTIVNMGPLYGVTDLREKHRYNITPWARRLSDDEDTDTEEEERLAVAAAMFGVPSRFKKGFTKHRSNASSSALQTIGPNSDRERLALDISSLKHQYAKLRERQRQAHIILSAACARQSMVPSSTSQAMNHLLVGKSALVSAKTRQLGPPPGSIPPKPKVSVSVPNVRVQSNRRDKHGVTLHWKDTKKSKDEADVGDGTETTTSVENTSEAMSSSPTSSKRDSIAESDSDSTSTELCDEPDRLSDVDSEEPTSTSDCYVMATDDEKSPRPGASPIVGNTPIHRRSETSSNSDVSYRDINNYDEVGASVEKTSSIALITDEIRRLSASDEIKSPPAHSEDFVNPTSSGCEEPSSSDLEKPFPIYETLGQPEISLKSESPIPESEKVALVAQTETNFDTLARYEFSINDDNPVITGKTVDSSIMGKLDSSFEEVSRIRGNEISSNIDVLSGLAPARPTITIESTQLREISQSNEEIFSYATPSEILRNSEHATPANSDVTRYQDLESSTSSLDSSKEIEKKYFSPSYVIGHLPISPITVNEKLSKANEISSLLDGMRILNPESRSFDVGTTGIVNGNFQSVTSVAASSSSDSCPSFSVNSLSIANSETPSEKYELTKNLTSDSATAIIIGTEKKISDVPRLSRSVEHSERKIHEETSVGESKNIFTNSSLIESWKDTRPESFDRNPKLDDQSLEKLISNESKLDSKMEPPLIISTLPLSDDSSRVTLGYDYKNSMKLLNDISGNLAEEKKISPQTPESGKSFSSGETMGPDSKNSSLATTPRSATADSRNVIFDRSDRSSMSSGSKTLTGRSFESESGTNEKSRLDAKSDLGRSIIEKSSPSTPISTDSLINRSEISPKFIVISSSSESCSPGRANKSSERSFSSDLQSPVSANSIKYRTNYVEGQEHLSESPMDVGSATSPFYPIANPNQKTPSPYGTNKRNTSSEISPEQKVTSETSSKFGLSTTRKKKNDDDSSKISTGNDDYDSGRPFEKELAEVLSSLPSERIKNDSISSGGHCKNDVGSYRENKSKIEKLVELDENYEGDTVSPLSSDKHAEKNRPAFVEKKKGAADSRDEKKCPSFTRETLKPFERSVSSLERRFGELKASRSDELIVDAHKKRSSDILQDLKHLEANTLEDGKADTSMLTRKTGYVWEDLQNLEARRQDNFSDSASEFSRGRLDLPRINVFTEPRISYVVQPKINLEEGSDSILKSYARKKSNGEPDDDRESKLGVWTKVKPRAGRDNGRRSSDRALKIIQENSAILHKILTCQAKKRLPDLEEISKEITISPINEEISKIFSPILEKMGLNEHEINEELARINFKDFDQMTTASGSEFDAKINDELCKLSLIDDAEIIDPMAVESAISTDYLDTREALIDRQINEELSKLLANYEEDSLIRVTGNRREELSSCTNHEIIEPLDISTISNNVFSYPSLSDSMEMKSNLETTEGAIISADDVPEYEDEVISDFGSSSRYAQASLSPRSDIDIYRELEKLDKISSGEIFPSSAPSIVAQKLIPPYVGECSPYPEVRPPSSLEYAAKTEKPFERSPIKSPYDTYKPYDYKSRISPLKSPNSPYLARSYEKPGHEEKFNFHDNPRTPPRLYDLDISSRSNLLSKETLEFRVKYDEEASKQTLRNDDLNLEPLSASLGDLDRGASYYSNESSTMKRFENDRSLMDGTKISPLEYSQNDFYTRNYDPVVSPINYSYGKNLSDYGTLPYDIAGDTVEDDTYSTLRRKNTLASSPNYQRDEPEFSNFMSHTFTEASAGPDEVSLRPVTLHSEFPEKLSQLVKYSDASRSASRETLNFRKASLNLGPLDGNASQRAPPGHGTTPSPKSLFSPFPARNSTRKPKELALKLGLYSPSSPDSNSLKRT